MAGFGVKFGKSQGMEGSSGNLMEFPIDPANTGAIFTGDPVSLSDGAAPFLGIQGYVEETTIAGTTLVGDSTPIIGMFRGCRYVDAEGSYKYVNRWDGVAGRTDIMAHVTVPAHQSFVAKLAAATPTKDQTLIGQRAAISYAAGDVPTGDSRSSLIPNAAGPFVIMGLAGFPDNSWADAEPLVEVVAVSQQLTFTSPT